MGHWLWSHCGLGLQPYWYSYIELNCLKSSRCLLNYSSTLWIFSGNNYFYHDNYFIVYNYFQHTETYYNYVFYKENLLISMKWLFVVLFPYFFVKKPKLCCCFLFHVNETFIIAILHPSDGFMLPDFHNELKLKCPRNSEALSISW